MVHVVSEKLLQFSYSVVTYNFQPDSDSRTFRYSRISTKDERLYKYKRVNNVENNNNNNNNNDNNSNNNNVISNDNNCNDNNLNQLIVFRSEKSNFHRHKEFVICVWAVILPGCPNRSRWLS
ncbi:hypothetical protein MS3_00000079 [Schistosoma haematobium]|uniref:Uncharacterized protein n=1 Tax=Schistosoma haematobium TaxID=6185 RepID=A0A922RZM5_SCHHA|nr:hypothetical protein MS3_00000079 [Schistosoma haematobium]KAH9587542.1 hypothetical protein MS3_00000079 [Schistosoma haematobium]